MNFILSMPPSINRTYGVTRSGKIPLYKKKPVRDWEWTAGWEVKRQRNRKIIPFTQDIRMDVTLYYSRNMDIDNGLKVLLDLFQKMGIYINDKQVVELYVRKFQDIKHPRVEVAIKEIV